MVGNWPRSVIVVGAGIVGLSTAWFLQERGVQVDVVDRGGVAAGASWGNAGWLAPGLAIPLQRARRPALRPALAAQPGRAAARARRASTRACGVPGPASPPTATGGVDRAVRANMPLNDECVEAYDVLAANGVVGTRHRGADHGGVPHAAQAESLLRELRRSTPPGSGSSTPSWTAAGCAEHAPLAGEALRRGCGSTVSATSTRAPSCMPWARPSCTRRDHVRRRGRRGAHRRPEGASSAQPRAPCCPPTRWCWPPALGCPAWPGSGACASRCGPAAATPSPCRSTILSPAPSTCPRRGWRARRTATGCG